MRFLPESCFAGAVKTRPGVAAHWSVQTASEQPSPAPLFPVPTEFAADPARAADLVASIIPPQAETPPPQKTLSHDYKATGFYVSKVILNVLV